MLTKLTHSLKDVGDGLLRPLNQSELKLALADLQDIGKNEPAVAAMLKAGGPLVRFHRRRADAVALPSRDRQSSTMRSSPPRFHRRWSRRSRC